MTQDQLYPIIQLSNQFKDLMMSVVSVVTLTNRQELEEAP